MTGMKTKELKNLLERAETWPAQAQAELVQAARDIEAEISRGRYHLSEDERKGIERGLAAMREGRFASEEQVAAILKKARSSRP
jgi:predicted transcriptional regulator